MPKPDIDPHHPLALAHMIGRVEKQVDTLTQTVQGNGADGGGLVTQVALLSQGQKAMGCDVKEIKNSLVASSGRRWHFWGPVAASGIVALSAVLISIMK